MSLFSLVFGKRRERYQSNGAGVGQQDPLTGEVIRASKTTAVRHERSTAGELVLVEVKKIGRIPNGGGGRAWGRQIGRTSNQERLRTGYDYVHSAVDDHSRLAYSEIHRNETGATSAEFMLRAATWFAQQGISRISEVMTDNAWAYTHSQAFAEALGLIGADHITIRPHCPWQNAKVERFNRTLQTEWAYRQIYLTNTERTDALQGWLDHYNYHRGHGSIGRRPPISRVTPT